MEQGSPSPLPLECPTCGSRMISATGVTASGQQRIVAYRCLTCRATWEHLAPGGNGRFGSLSTSPTGE